MKPKVVFVSNLAEYLLRFRGKLMQGFVEQGFDVTGCVSTKLEALDPWQHLGIHYRHFALDRTGMNPIREWKTLRELTNILQEIKPNLVISNSIKLNIWASYAAHAAHVPHIVSIVSGLGTPFVKRKGMVRALIHHTVRLLAKRAFSYNHLVILQNRDDEAELRRLRLLPPGVSTLVTQGSGVDLNEFPFEPLVPGPMTFVFVGRLQREKGIVEFLEAASVLKSNYPEARFHVVGPLDDHPLALTRADLEPYLKAEVVRYFGALEDVRPLLKKASVFVLPSYREGMPRATLEALSTGRAVITTNVPGCRETVIDQHNGLVVEARSVAALTQAMELLLRNPTQIAQMSIASRKLAEERFDVDKVNSQILLALTKERPSRRAERSHPEI